MADKYNISDVFISYSRHDKDFAHRLFDRLKSEDREVWADWEDIPLTADWWEEIQAGIEGASTFVFIISPDSVISDICFKEIDHAVKSNKRIVPILFRGVTDPEHQEKMHSAVSSHNWIYFQEDDNFDDAYQKLIISIETDLGYVQAHTRYLVRAAEWDDHDRKTSYLLPDAEIAEAEMWLSQSGAKDPKPTQVQTEYIFDSRNQKVKRDRRNQILVGIVGVVFIILSVLAFLQFQQAQRQTTLAQHMLLAQYSQIALTNNNTDLSIALGIHSNSLGLTVKGDNEPVSFAERTLFDASERALADAAYSGGTVKRFVAHKNGVHAVAFNHDGSLAVSGDEDGIVFVWNISTGKDLLRIEAHSSQVNAIDIDSNSQYIVSVACGEYDDVNFDCLRGEIILWDFNTGEEIRRFEGHENDVTTIEFDQWGKRLLSGSVDRTMRLWDVETGEQLGVYDAHLGKVVDVAFHPLEPNLAVSMAIDTPPPIMGFRNRNCCYLL